MDSTLLINIIRIIFKWFGKEGELSLLKKLTAVTLADKKNQKLLFT